jgi:hypothetical protein
MEMLYGILTKVVLTVEYIYARYVNIGSSKQAELQCMITSVLATATSTEIPA